MKRPLLQIRHESGFFLPIVLVITILALSLIGMLLHLYKNDLILTESMVHQIEAETLIQMTIEEFSNNAIHYSETMDTVVYQYPNGEVLVDYERISVNTWELNCLLTLENGVFQLSTSFPITVDTSSG